MRKEKKPNAFLAFADRYLMWIFGVVGILAAVYALWLQSGGISVASGTPVVSFGFKYISFPLAFGVLIVALGGGYAINRYFRSEAEKSSEYKKISSSDFLHTSRWYMILIPISAVMAFLSSVVWMVLVGAGALAFSGSGLICFKIWQMQEAKEQAAGADRK